MLRFSSCSILIRCVFYLLVFDGDAGSLDIAQFDQHRDDSLCINCASVFVGRVVTGRQRDTRSLGLYRIPREKRSIISSAGGTKAYTRETVSRQSAFGGQVSKALMYQTITLHCTLIIICVNLHCGWGGVEWGWEGGWIEHWCQSLQPSSPSCHCCWCWAIHYLDRLWTQVTNSKKNASERLFCCPRSYFSTAS